MYSRDAHLQSVLDLLCRSVVADPKCSADAERTIGIVAERLRRTPENGPAMQEPMRLPVCALLDEALAAGTPLLEAFRAVEPQLTWGRRKGDLGDDRFRACHANAMLAGPGGLEPREDVQVGVSLMAPNTSYPVHHHAPEEVYLVLSDGEWWNEVEGWYRPGMGGTVYHRPDLRHATRSGSKPLLALWALPI
jgi:mannose-6-phosphate isomerase-like protein (cupin superfamily)